MSLIGDAMREAERTQRDQPRRPSKPLGTIVVPPKRHRSRTRSRLFAVAGVSVVAGASAVGARTLTLRAPAARSPAVLFAERELSAAPVQVAHAATAKPKTPPADTLNPTLRATPSPMVAPVIASPAKAPVQVGAVIAPKPVPVIAPKPVPRRVIGPLPPAPDVFPRRPSKPVPPPASLDARDSLFRQAYLRQVSNDLTAAQRLYEQALASGDAPSTAYNDFGVLLDQLGQQDAALDMFRQATARDGKNVDAWVNLGDHLAEMGQSVDALTAFARAGQIDPARADLMPRLAHAYEAVGDTTAARKVFERAVAAHPTSPTAHYALGQFLQTQHEVAAAIDHYQRFVDLARKAYPASTVAAVKDHIAALRKTLP